MGSKNFARALRAFARRTPFKPFTVQLVSGEKIEIEHPEAVLFRGEVAVYIGPKGDIAIFDHEGVAQVTDAGRTKV